LMKVLHTWPEAVNPQVVIDGEREPSVRANAMAALADPEGLLGDVGDLLVSASTALRLTVRDVDRAMAIPRSSDALQADAVTQQLADLRRTSAGDPAAAVHALAQAAECLRAIDAWGRQQLGDDAPALQPLLRVLHHFGGPASAAAAAPPEPARLDGPVRLAPAFASVEAPRNRNDVRLALRSARHWLETHEPSSPVAVLLKQAERMVGQRFSEVADAVPLELLRRWEADETTAGEVP